MCGVCTHAFDFWLFLEWLEVVRLFWCHRLLVVMEGACFDARQGEGGGEGGRGTQSIARNHQIYTAQE